MANKIQSNTVGLHTALEQSLGVLPATPVWRELAQNSFGDFGAKVEATEREVMTTDRQMRKGMVTAVDSTAAYNIDMTQRGNEQAYCGMMFALPHEKPTTAPIFGREGLGGAVRLDVSTISPTAINLSAALTGVKTNDIVVLHKAKKEINNNSPQVVSAIAAGDLTVAPLNVGSTLVAEATSTAELTVVGHRFGAGEITAVGEATQVTLTSAAAGYSFIADAQLSAGEWIFVGGDAAINRFDEMNPFYARIKEVTATTLVLDTTTSPVAAVVATTKQITLYYGTFIHNEEDMNKIRMLSWTMERALGNDGAGTQAEYVKGCVASELSLSMEQRSKAAMDVSYMALDTYYRDGTQGLINGTRIKADSETPAYNMSTDVYRQRLAINSRTTMNPSALYAMVQTLSININNNVSGDTAIGQATAFDMSTGNFAVTGSLTAYFNKVDAIKAVRCNCTVGIDIILARENAGTVLDVPAVTLGGSSLKIEKDTPITIDLDTAAFKSKYGFTMGLTQFRYLPTVAMPATLVDCVC